MKKANKEINLPICIDLDGGLVRGTISLESLVLYLKFQPWKIFNVLNWLFKGIAYCKSELAKRIKIHVESLPYNKDVLEFIKQMKDKGHQIFLISSANEKPVQKIADYIGLFDGIISSDERNHLKGNTKADALEKQFGKGGYIFVGSDGKNLKAMNQAHETLLINVSSYRQTRVTSEKKILIDNQNSAKDFIKTMRLHQWTKNMLIFLPLIASHQILNLALIKDSLLAFISFSFLASSIYILNDILDIPSDRLHKEKQNRPIPSGRISIRRALLLSFTLIFLSFVIGLVALPIAYLYVLLIYFLLTTVYSFYVKSVRLVDVLFLAILFITRVIAGYAATDLVYSNWMLAFTGFLFLSLAFVKRYAEIQRATSEKIKGRGYRIKDKQIISQFGITVGYLSVLILALYIESDVVFNLYTKPYMLWGVCPVVIYIISHLWMEAEEGKVLEDPVTYVLTKDYRFIVSLGIAAFFMLLAV